MSSVRLEKIEKRFGATEVITGVTLEIEAGEFVVFVGASGSGKSTLLRIIAGLEEASAGRVLIGGSDVTDTPPSERGVSMVFQSYALYPHMSARENIAFGLKLARTAKETIAARVDRVAAMLQIAPLLERKPRELSGGQRQRVAIARAIVREPKVFLFDEPLSNLDAALRARTRLEIMELHRALASTMIYVTHDQVEAMTLADRMVILNRGRIEQVGPPAELYHRPATLYVALFLGSPAMNVLKPAAMDNDHAVLASGERLALPAGGFQSAAAIGIRPEDVAIEDLAVEDMAAEEEGLSARIALVEELGETRIVHARLADGTPLAFRSRDLGERDIGRAVRLSLPPEHLHLFDAEGRRLN